MYESDCVCVIAHVLITSVSCVSVRMKTSVMSIDVCHSHHHWTSSYSMHIYTNEYMCIRTRALKRVRRTFMNSWICLPLPFSDVTCSIDMWITTLAFEHKHVGRHPYTDSWILMTKWIYSSTFIQQWPERRTTVNRTCACQYHALYVLGMKYCEMPTSVK